MIRAAPSARDVTPETDSRATGRCPLPVALQSPQALTVEVCSTLAEHGCPLAPRVEECVRFENLLADLSATFINLPGPEIDSRIESSLRRLVEFLGVDRGGLGQLSEDRKQLVVTHSYQMPGIPHLPRVILDEEWPWYASTIYGGEPLRLPDLPGCLPPRAAREREYCARVGMKAHVMVPLKVQDRVVGTIGFASFHGRRDWPDDLVLRLRRVGEILTNALSRKQADEALRAREQSLQQTREGLRRLASRLLYAQEEERRRIAREMHDDWTQRLAVLGIDLAKLETHIGSPEKALPILKWMQEELFDLSEDVHAVSRQLHPSILDDLGLAEALRSECASFSHREGVAVTYRPPQSAVALPKDAALGVYRVAQEALRNIAKHAAVKEATVSLAMTSSELVLAVEDDGAGFDSTSPHAKHGLGLYSMAERVRLIQGELSVTSAPGRGTTVTVRVPLGGSEL
jgi:two-component system, NarL family, sensor kinase